MKFSCITQKERKCNVCKRWPCNSYHEHLEIQSDYGRNSFDKGIFLKTNKRREELGLLYNRHKLKP
jgi:hypothetical protein